VCKKKDY
jgi:hypothetical protein